MDRNSLMASLTGDGPEQDLFGDVPVEDGHANGSGTAAGDSDDPSGSTAPPPSTPGSAPPPVISSGPIAAAESTGSAPAPSAAGAPATGHSNGASSLAQSGLLGAANASVENEDDNGGGGLFDAVDEEEQRKEQQLKSEANAEEQRRLQEQQRQEEEARQRQMQMQQEQEQQLQQPSYGYTSQPNMSAVYPQQQQQSAMMQSVNLNYTNTPQQQQHQQPQYHQTQTGMQNMTLQPPSQGFYREHPPSTISSGPPPPSNTFGGGLTGNQYYYGTQQSQSHHSVGMHNAAPPIMGNSRMMQSHHQSAQIRKITLVKPEEVPPLYSDIQVTEPMLIQQQNFLLSSPPYWSYQITSQLTPPQQGTWLVRRRFRHVVALEERLRQTCPGSILPPRPDKHATRALEEASTQQSAEFAMQRAQELRQYLNALARHPVAGQSQILRLFLGLQDDIGTAWPEVSGNAFTKLGAVAAGMSMKVAESTQMTSGNAPAHEWEDDAELLALSSSENLRMGAVSQAVPKLEGTVSLFREQGDAAGAAGMELSKVTKLPANEDFKVCDVLSNGLLRHGRRNKRLALELSGAMDSFLQQYKMVRYEKMALQDRRQAIQRKSTYRRGADQRAMHLAQQQRQLQSSGQMGQLNQLERNAIQTDSMANEFVGEAEEIAARLKSEIHRVAIDRRTQWNASMKTIASAMKEACAERLAIWESTLEAFKALPGALPTDERPMNGSGLMVPGPPPGSMASSQMDGSTMPAQEADVNSGAPDLRSNFDNSNINSRAAVGP